MKKNLSFDLGFLVDDVMSRVCFAILFMTLSSIQ